MRSRLLTLLLVTAVLPLVVGGVGLRSLCQSLCTIDDRHMPVAESCCTPEPAERGSGEPCDGECLIAAIDLSAVSADKTDRLDPPPLVAVVMADVLAKPVAAAGFVAAPGPAPPPPTLLSLSCRLDC